MAKQKQDDQLELTHSSYVKTQDVTLKTCRRQWMIGRSGERWSGISVLAARHDDDDDVETLPTEIAREILDLLNNVPDTNLYEVLRNIILLRTGESEEKKTNKPL